MERRYFRSEIPATFAYTMPSSSPVDTWERFARFHRVATASMDERLRERFGYSLDDYDVLHQIAALGEPIRMGELAQRLLVANSSCNRIVGRLAAAELVERVRGEHDRREVFVVLTAEGRRLRRRMAAVHVRDIERLIDSPLSAQQLALLDSALRDLLADAGAAPGVT